MTLEELKEEAVELEQVALFLDHNIHKFMARVEKFKKAVEEYERIHASADTNF